MNQRDSFHCILQVSPSELPGARIVQIGDACIPCMKLPQLDTRFQCSFDQAARELQRLPRFFFEPDGSFVWVQDTSSNRYQLDGTLYDDGFRLLNIELKGTCDQDMLGDFLTCLGWPAEKILFQLVWHGLHLAESEFRRHFVADSHF